MALSHANTKVDQWQLFTSVIPSVASGIAI